METESDLPVLRGPAEPLHKKHKLRWSHRVRLIGEKVTDPVIHSCEICNLPILIYGRMIPCKHVFCLNCARKCDKSCYRCKEPVSRIEQTAVGSVFVCNFEGPRHSWQGCRRTYLSPRDLQAHIDHRHLKTTKGRGSSASTGAANVSNAIAVSSSLHQMAVPQLNPAVAAVAQVAAQLVSHSAHLQGNSAGMPSVGLSRPDFSASTAVSASHHSSAQYGQNQPPTTQYQQPNPGYQAAPSQQQSSGSGYQNMPPSMQQQPPGQGGPPRAGNLISLTIQDHDNHFRGGVGGNQPSGGPPPQQQYPAHSFAPTQQAPASHAMPDMSRPPPNFSSPPPMGGSGQSLPPPQGGLPPPQRVSLPNTNLPPPGRQPPQYQPYNQPPDGSPRQSWGGGPPPRGPPPMSGPPPGRSGPPLGPPSRSSSGPPPRHYYN